MKKWPQRKRTFSAAVEREPQRGKNARLIDACTGRSAESASADSVDRCLFGRSDWRKP